MSYMPFVRACFATAVLASSAIAPAFAGDPLFTVTTEKGAVVTPIEQADLEKIGKTTITTTVFALDSEKHQITGVLMRDLATYTKAKGTDIKFTALDGYSLDVPYSDFTTYDVVLATEIDGKPLSVRDKGPAWLIYPASDHPELKDTVYESRSVWQVKTIAFD